VSSRRTLILLLAVGLGLVAVFFLYTYVNGIEDDVEDQYQLTNVLKAAEPVPANTLGEVAIEESLVETGQIPREFRPEGAITNSDAIRGRVALFDIPPGLAITDGMFVSADEVSVSFRRRLEQPNFTTVTVRVDDVRGVGGLLVPGDEVNIYVSAPLSIDDATFDALVAEKGLAPNEPYFQPPNYVQNLYQRVHVIAVGTTTVQLPGESVTNETNTEEDVAAETEEVDAGLITFNVPPAAVQKIASWIDNVYLSLVPEDYAPEAIEAPPVLWAQEDFPGQNPDQLTPYGPDETGKGDE
jgi:Flp pilus assembly protein CpaB